MEYSVPDSLRKSDPAYVRYEQISPIWEFIEITSFQNSTRIPLLQEVFHDFPIRGHCCLLILLFVPLYFSLIVAQETYSSGFPEHLQKILLGHFCLDTVFVGLLLNSLPALGSLLKVRATTFSPLYP